MTKTADLTPPLGYPGGTCHVVERIEQDVRNPRLKSQLEQEVEQGKDLSNSDARQVYPPERENGAGVAKKLLISPHAQYRMDLRGITVPEIRAALRSFSKQLNDWKAQRSPLYDKYYYDLSSGGKVEWVDPRGNVFIVFVASGMGEVTLITTYRKGEGDPLPEDCGNRMAGMAHRVLARFVSAQ